MDGISNFTITFSFSNEQNLFSPGTKSPKSNMSPKTRKSTSSLVFSLFFWTLVLGVFISILFAYVIPSNSDEWKYTTTHTVTTSVGASSTTSGPEPTFTDLKEALLAAAAAGSWKDTSSSLKQGVKPSIRDSELRTPLHLAAANGDRSTVKLLLGYKDTGWFADGGVTPLHLAAENGNTGAVKLITGLSGHVWHKERAASPSAIEKIKEAMDHKFDRHLQDFFDRKTFTARELAVINGHQATALAFPMSSGDDLLHAFSCACMLGDMDMVETLWHHNEKKRPWEYQHGSPEKHIRWFPAPPFHLAVMSGNRATVAFLLEKGFKATTESRKTWKAYPPYNSPAHYAAIVGDAQLLVMLERRGAALTAVNSVHRTPLSYAVESGNEDAVELLVKRKYPDRGGIFTSASKAPSLTYLGKGHVWGGKGSSLATVSSDRIKKALGSVGVVR